MNIVCRLNKTEPFEIQQVATYIDFGLTSNLVTLL